jgi:thioredoxin reductase (NADPH)
LASQALIATVIIPGFLILASGLRGHRRCVPASLRVNSKQIRLEVFSMETIAFDLRQLKRAPLANEHVAAIRAAGTERIYPAGEIIVRQGDPMDRFTYLLEGEIEVIDAFTGERTLPFSLGPGQYMGEIAFLSGGKFTMPMRAAKDTRVVELTVGACLH